MRAISRMAHFAGSGFRNTACDPFEPQESASTPRWIEISRNAS